MHWILITALGVAATLGVERWKKPALTWITKPLASTAFIALALEQGALESTFGIAILIALAFSWLGDVLLIGKSQKMFLGGLVAFLLGHLGFAASFLFLSPNWGHVGIALLLCATMAFVVCRWLLPQVPEKLKKPVIAYVVVITAMVAMAGGITEHPKGLHLLCAAVAFYLSDLSVATQRFVSDRFFHRLWGLPLYYAAQLAFALSLP